MWATSDLGINLETLVAGSPNASLINARDTFSFNAITFDGNYAGAIKVAGVASSPSIVEAVSVSVSSVPEPSTYAMALAGLACGGFSMWRRRKRA